MPDSSMDTGSSAQPILIALVGAGWWQQGWHLPHLSRNDDVKISAIVEPSPHPKSNLNPNLDPVEALVKACGDQCCHFGSVEELLQSDVGKSMDGVIVCTPHSTHFPIAQQLLLERTRRLQQIEKEQQSTDNMTSRDDDSNNKRPAHKPLHIFMEKPMTTDVHQAKLLHGLVLKFTPEQHGCFLLNHSANFREQARMAKELVQGGSIGQIRHMMGSMASPLSWLFGDPDNCGWTQPSRGMLGNGFAWGQSSHLLAWMFHVTNVTPYRVYCTMTHSDTSGADVSHAATIHCRDHDNHDISVSVSGTCLLPGNEHGDPPVGKHIQVEIYGTEGTLIYKGNDHDPTSGRLELWSEDRDVQVFCQDLGFHFENTDQAGTGPESLQSFLQACRGRTDYYVGADVSVGLKSVQTLDAMYRSHASKAAEDVLHLSE